MPPLDPTIEECLRDAVRAAAGRAEARAVVERVYADLATEIDRRRPVCVVSGRCCRFEEFGHRLYVTTLELASFLHGFEQGQAARPHALAQAIERWDGAGCPFQVARLCGVHAFRPFGCRMFFCDATSTQWQHEAYEAFHARLKRAHEELDVPYFYLEWRQAIGAVLGVKPC
jgi:Fe-S-cluster containining protein